MIMAYNLSAEALNVAVWIGCLNLVSGLGEGWV